MKLAAPASMPSPLHIDNEHCWDAQVVGVSKLRTKYESHEAKRGLCAAYDLFLADERIIPVLPKLLGVLPPTSLAAPCVGVKRKRQGLLLASRLYVVKHDAWCVCAAGRDFFKKKKQPIPVDLSRKDWGQQIARACQATYMFHTGGTCINIRCCIARHAKRQSIACFHVLQDCASAGLYGHVFLFLQRCFAQRL